jgi:hypothetical protein
MEFFKRMAESPRETIQSTIIDQNTFLRILQAETPYMKSGFKTEPGTGASLLQAPQGDPETRTTKFYKDNQYWILGEVDKYLDQNQREIKELKVREELAKDENRQYDDESMDQGLMAAIEKNDNEK